MKKKKIRILCDLTMGIEAILFVVLSIPGSLFLIWAANRELLSKTSLSDIICGWFIILFSIFWMGLIFVIIIPNFWAFIELDTDGIRLNQIYKKTPIIPYKKLWNFKLAYYYHMGSLRYFIVIGCVELSPEQLVRINLVQNSEHLVKIQLTKRNYYRLREILPPEQREKLISLYCDDSSEEQSDALMYYKRIEAREKRKRRSLQKKHKNRKKR